VRVVLLDPGVDPVTEALGGVTGEPALTGSVPSATAPAATVPATAPVTVPVTVPATVPVTTVGGGG
jgi:hypothetical protein